VDQAVRERITGFRDTPELEHWLLRATRAQAARQPFN